ncbi:MAG: PAS domain S-box protein, partial [Bacteroidota bacterium]|nr:PAS domain S-box protein [Bacteroidota bacterium]
MASSQKNIVVIFSLIGFLIGSFLPLFTWILAINRYNVTFNLSSIGYIHTKELSIYIIDTTPIFLAIVFYLLVSFSIKIRFSLESTIEKMNRVLEKNSEFANKIGQGDLQTEIKVEENDNLGKSLLLMRNNLIENKQRETKQSWVAKGKEILGDILRFHNKIEDLSYETLVALVDYTNSAQGAFYIYNEEEKLLSSIATYAYNRKKYQHKTFKIGEGLIGAAAYEKNIIYRKEIPKDFTTISSGILGDKKPQTILITPLLGSEKLQGIIEIASLDSELDDRVINLMREISEIVGQTVFNLSLNERTENLLQESREMTYKLKKNEDELRRNAEQMKLTQKEIEETNRKLASQIEEVERARKRLYSLLENASEVISIYNQNGIVTYESPSIIHILGYTPDELIGKDGLSIYNEDGNLKIKNAFEQLITNPEKPVSFELLFEKNDGQEIWLETIGRNLLSNLAINGIIFNTRDITVRKIAEKAQRMSGRMQALSENSPDMIIRVNTEGKFFYANPIAQEFINLGVKQIIGKNLEEVQLSSEIKEVFSNTLNKILNKPVKIETETTFNLDNSTKERIVQFNAIPEFNEVNELETILFVAHDITEQKQIQIEIEKKNRSITESINYAKRIQTAILPTQNTIRNMLEKSFMFYLPRDVVSGDIPWIYERDNVKYIAAIDCTGHGVPGALLSFISYFLINNIISTRGNELDSGEILDLLHQDVRKTLNQDTPDAEARDGMDIALCKILYDKNELDYSGAHRPLYLLNND